MCRWRVLISLWVFLFPVKSIKAGESIQEWDEVLIVTDTVVAETPRAENQRCSSRCSGARKRFAFANAGHLLSLGGLSAQYIALANAKPIGLTGTLTLYYSGIATEILCSRLAVNNYFMANRIIEDACECDRIAIGTYQRVFWGGAVIILAGSILSQIIPQVEIASWSSEDHKKEARLSVSPFGLGVAAVGQLVLLLNNANAMGEAYSAKVHCWRKPISIIPLINHDFIGAQLVSHF